MTHAAPAGDDVAVTRAFDTPTWWHDGPVAVAHDVRSMHNVGAVFRTADGAGFAGVVCSGITGSPPDPRIAKVALGAEETLPHVAAPNLPALLAMLEGVHVVLLEQHVDAVAHTDLDVPDGPLALVVCGELDGAPPELVARADRIVEIPMFGDKESLNVSVAFGVAAYSIAARHRDAADGLVARRGRRPVREGVLTRGLTQGPAPHREH